jgi:hypothetical protein
VKLGETVSIVALIAVIVSYVILSWIAYFNPSFLEDDSPPPLEVQQLPKNVQTT